MTNEEGGELDTQKAEKAVWLMRCPALVSRSWNSHSHTTPTDLLSSSSSPSIAKVIVSVDPLRSDNDDTTTTTTNDDNGDSSSSTQATPRLNQGIRLGIALTPCNPCTQIVINQAIHACNSSSSPFWHVKDVRQRIRSITF